jgi:hypothetical protein
MQPIFVLSTERDGSTPSVLGFYKEHETQKMLDELVRCLRMECCTSRHLRLTVDWYNPEQPVRRLP